MTIANKLPPKLRRLLLGVLLMAIVILAVILAIQVGSSRPDTSQDLGAPVLLQVTAEILQDRATILEIPSLGVTVTIPAGAFRQQALISLTPREPNLFTAADDPWRRPVILNAELFDHQGVLLPSFEFEQPVVVCFKLGVPGWRAFLEYPPDFAVQQHPTLPGGARWTSLPLVIHGADRELCGLVSHFSLIALALRQPAPTPAPVYELYGS